MTGLIALSMLVGMSSCSGSDGPDHAVDNADYYGLTISLSAETTSVKQPETRADIWDDPYPEEPGFPSEYDIDNVTIYLVTTDNNVFQFAPTPVSATDNSRKYEVKVDRNASYVKHNADGTATLSGRIVAIANYPDGAAPANPFSDSPYPLDYLSTSGVIPMWGVSTITDLALVADATVDAGDLKLLRSVPKITIELADELKDTYKITSITADQDGYLSTANCFPTGGVAVPSTGKLGIEGCFNASAVTDQATPQFFNLGGNRIWGYPAERECPLTPAGHPLSFTVTIDRIHGTSAPFTGKVYLCDYTSGKPDFSTAFERLVRNHDYQYRISLSELEFIISFKEWIFGGKVHVELE